MSNIKRNLLLILFLSVIATGLKADVFMNSVQLEDSIEKNIKEKISNIISDKDFIISVQVIPLKEENKKSKRGKNKKTLINPLMKFDLSDEVSDYQETATNKEFKIKTIDASIYLNDKLTENVRSNVKLVLEKSFVKLGPYSINYTFKEFTKTENIYGEKVEKLPFYKEYNVYILVASLILIFILLTLFGISRFQKVGLLLVQALEKIKPETEINGGPSVAFGGAAGGAATSTSHSEVKTTYSQDNSDIQTKTFEHESHSEKNSVEVIMAKTEGVNRFISFVKEDVKKSSNQIRKWQLLGTTVSRQAIGLTLNSLDFPDLKKLMDNFTEQEKKSLKLAKSLLTIDSNIKEIDNFILAEMVDVVVEPPVISDLELQESIFSCDKEKIAQVVQEDPSIGADILSLLPESVANDICKSLDKATFATVLSESLSISKEQEEQRFSKIKEKLQSSEEEAVETLSPLITNSMALLSVVDRNKEESIIDFLTKVKEFDEMEEILLNNFPASLTHNLPGEVTKSVLITLDIKARVAYIALQDIAKRSELLELIAPPESKIAQMHEIELAKIIEKDGPIQQILDDKKQIEDSFNYVLRNLVRSGSHREEVLEVLRPWLQDKYGKQKNEKEQA